jgi:hypothetical protein
MATYLSPHKGPQSDPQKEPSADGLDTGLGGSWFNEALRRYTKEGEGRFARLGARYGILGFAKGQKITEEDMQRLGSNVASEVANGAFAYMIVKVSDMKLSNAGL